MLQINRVVSPVCVGAREWPFLHCFTSGHVDDQTAARFQNAKYLSDVIAVRVKEVSHIDEQNFGERTIDPRKRTKLSLDELHPPRGNRRLIHICGLFQHSIRLIYPKNLTSGCARSNGPKGPTGAKSKFKNLILGFWRQCIDRKPVRFIVHNGHEPSCQRSERAGRVPQLPAEQVPHSIQTAIGAQDDVAIPRQVLMTIPHCLAAMLASRSSITSRRFLSQAGRSGCCGRHPAFAPAMAGEW